MASGIRRVVAGRGGEISGISFVILYQIRLCRAEDYGRVTAETGTAFRSRFDDLDGRAGEVMSNKMWGGRFTERPDAIMEEINVSIDVDRHLYAQDTIDVIDAALAAFQHALASRALEHAATVMPGFTHLQTAQPVTFGHHLLAYVEMAARDRGRFADARRRLNESPLGAAALAGTSFPIDRAATAKALGFDRPMANSLDAVSDRDFVLETLSAAAICAIHLSRFRSEEHTSELQSRGHLVCR